MKAAHILLGVAGLGALVLGSLAWRAQLSRTRPPQLGLLDGKLRPCGDRPNAVCSEDPRPDHHVEPLSFQGFPDEAMARLQRLLATQPRARIIGSGGTYLHAEFRSALWGFVDDVEFRVDAGAKVIHLRSASRQGYSDMGVNRKRVEALRAAFGK